MSGWNLSSAVAGIPSLRGCFISIMPDALLFDSWIREGESWISEQVAAYFGDLVRSNREGLKALNSWSSDMQVTIESSDILLVLKEIQSDFVIGVVFERNAPLGMVRIYVKKLIDRLEPMIPTEGLEERPKSIRILEFLQRYAPDPHTVMLRVALKMNLSMDELNNSDRAQSLNAEELEMIAKEILGLESLNI